MEKNYSLLRPFDLEAAKRGEKICGQQAKDHYEFVTGPDKFGSCCFTRDGVYVCRTTEFMHMAPLAWVEGKPVYKNDVLYYNNTGSEPGSKFIAKNYHPLGIAGETYWNDGSNYTDKDAWERIDLLTWQKPKTKREGWINIYINTNYKQEEVPTCGIIYQTQKQADNASTKRRITCIHIEWEE